MLESKPPNSEEELQTLARRTPTGAVALCGLAVAIVVWIWIAFYLFAFLPRGMVR
jgi:type VI protein secretion system component VasF